MNCQGHISWEACTLITSSEPTNHRFGTGFIICHIEQKSYILTCAHVISDVGNGDKIKANGQPATLVAMGANDGLDLAVISTDKILDKPVVTLGACGGIGVPFFTAGFRTFGQHFAISPLYGKVITPASLESRNYSGLIQSWNLDIEQNGRLHNGYSGSPVIDEETSFCFGVISYKQGDGETGLAISIEELEKVWPSLPVNLIKKSSSDKPYLDRLFSRATKAYLTGNLDSALNLYRQVQEKSPLFPRTETMIRSIEKELEKKYVDAFGQIKPKKLQQLSFSDIQFADNPEPRCPVVLVLDTSSSMSEVDIQQINSGIEVFREAILQDPIASLRVEIATISFGPIKLVHDFVLVDEFSLPPLDITDSAPIGEAILFGLEMLESRKLTYKENYIQYCVPWLFLLTKGIPTSSWKSEAAQAKQSVEDKKAIFFVLGVKEANMDVLSQISPASDPPVMLEGVNFKDLFRWISEPRRTESDVDIELPPTSGWTEVEL